MIKSKYLIRNTNLLKKNLKKKFFLIKNKIKFLIIKSYYLKILILKLKANNNLKKLIKNYKNKILIEKKKKLFKIPNIINFNNKINYKKKIIIIKSNNKKKIKKYNHIEILKKFKIYDKSDKIIIIQEPLINLYKSLIKFIFKLQKKEHNFREINIKYILNFKEILNSGQLPKFLKNLFIVNKNKYLISTSEVSLINLFLNKFIEETKLPLKLISFSKCFRNEKNNYGKKNKGLIRQNEFDKIELMLITDVKNSYKDLTEILKYSEKILKKLKLKYRIILLKGKDLNFSSSKTYDIELWSPALKKYIEISSSTNTESFQSNRLNLKYKFNKNIKNSHIINSSSLAIGRLFSILIESYQCEIGIKIPKILKKYNNNIKIIKY